MEPRVAARLEPRHMIRSAYRCYLPVLTGFARDHCAGPDRHSRPRSVRDRGRVTTRCSAQKRNGGADRDRTDDLLIANEALSQLSYSPTESARARVLFRRIPNLAEREGFEPSERLRAQRFSRPPHSTALASLRANTNLASPGMASCAKRKRCPAGPVTGGPRGRRARSSVGGNGRASRIPRAGALGPRATTLGESPRGVPRPATESGLGACVRRGRPG